MSKDTRIGERELAYEEYWNLGENRNLSELSRRIGKSRQTVIRWNKEENWEERIKNRENKVKEKIEEEVIEKEKNRRMDLVKATRGLVNKAIREVMEGKIKIRNINDLEKLIRLEFDLIGTPLGAIEEDKEEVSKVNGNLSPEDILKIQKATEGITKCLDEI
ncbi:MAG: hypothetical protein ACRDBY_14350 [Cetobacterium sp.]